MGVNVILCVSELCENPGSHFHNTVTFPHFSSLGCFFFHIYLSVTASPVCEALFPPKIKSGFLSTGDGVVGG